MISDAHEVLAACADAHAFFFKTISANDVGGTTGHQAGFYMPVNTWPMFFDAPGVKGETRDRHISVHWIDGTITRSRFIWYGKRTRSEYRMTRVLSHLGPEYVGHGLVMVRS